MKHQPKGLELKNQIELASGLKVTDAKLRACNVTPALQAPEFEARSNQAPPALTQAPKGAPHLHLQYPSGMHTHKTHWRQTYWKQVAWDTLPQLPTGTLNQRQLTQDMANCQPKEVSPGKQFCQPPTWQIGRGFERNSGVFRIFKGLTIFDLKPNFESKS